MVCVWQLLPSRTIVIDIFTPPVDYYTATLQPHKADTNALIHKME